MYGIKKIFRALLLVSLSTSALNCASIGQSLRNLVGEKDEKPAASPNPPVTSFSNHPNMPNGTERQYRRVTKDNFADDQGLEESAGSLWRKEGQASYLFSQNNLRNLGDIINVDVDGKAADNLTAKMNIIKQNLARIENPLAKGTAKAGAKDGRAPAEQAAPTADPNQDAANGDKAKEAAAKKFDTVPCRIVERNPDGSYRVKGQTSVYVGRHEYRLIVVGLVRPEDVNSDAVTSTKLIDGKYDLVASNKDTKNETYH